ncbi:thermonuclease family protein [uncultured Sphingomonas sp.]|uniref:thermonuclease family protein n=1 Tax=uncultured Sphingomonas sp. TaxID=158754 RepID=UPI0030D91BB8
MLRASYAAALALCAAPVAAEPATVARITDGDTFRTTSGERIRIAAIDAPETIRSNAKCAAEITRGKASTAELRALIEGRAVDLTRTGQSYNRTVAIVRLDGRDVAAEMVRRGAARPWLRHAPKPDWCS